MAIYIALGEPKILTYQYELLQSFRGHLSTSFHCYSK